VAVTGIGVVSPLGNDPGTFFANLVAGRSGVRRLEGRSFERLGIRVGAPAAFDAASHCPAARVRTHDRVSQFALSAAAPALESAEGALERADRRRAAGKWLAASNVAGAPTRIPRRSNERPSSRRTAERPAARLSKKVTGSLPSGETTPMPVTATRLKARPRPSP
jgi:3-oxoacyl-(acyl-carrier-protein) synthase